VRTALEEDAAAVSAALEVSSLVAQCLIARAASRGGWLDPPAIAPTRPTCCWLSSTGSAAALGSP